MQRSVYVGNSYPGVTYTIAGNGISLLRLSYRRGQACVAYSYTVGMRRPELWEWARKELTPTSFLYQYLTQVINAEVGELLSTLILSDDEINTHSTFLLPNCHIIYQLWQF